MDQDWSFGAWLRCRRKGLDLTQEELARRVDYSRSAIRRIEADELRPSKELAQRLAEHLAISEEQRDQFVRIARGERGFATLVPFPWAELPVSPPMTTSRPSTRPHGHLPIALTSFVGRAPEIAEVKRLLQSTRLLTLTGSGGCGKTRLALEVATDLAAVIGNTYPDGIWLVELAPLADSTLVPGVVAAAVGVREGPGQPIQMTLVAFLRSRHLLLLVDNCVHLIAACAKLIEAILRACPRVTVLATSREAMGLVGEVAWRVPSLTLPDDNPRTGGNQGDGVLESEAAQLFAARARAVDARFTLTMANAPTVALICRRLDGIPLALELAAARLNVLKVEQIAARLDDRFRLLTCGSRNALPRQQTLRATLDWSYNLLSEPERRLLRRLAVFAGGCTLEAAEVVCSAEGVAEAEVLDLLAQLVDKSLVLVDKETDEPRYRLLETIRQYGSDRLVEVDEAHAVRERHRDWFLALAERTEPRLLGLQQIQWLDRLAEENDNLRAALEWGLVAEPAVGARLAGCLWQFWYFRSQISEGIRWLDAALAAAPRGTALYAKLLTANGMLLRDGRNLERSRACSDEAISLYRESGDNFYGGWALNNLGCIPLTEEGDRIQGRALLEESVRLFQVAGYRPGIAMSLRDLGIYARVENEDSRAQALFEESLAILREVGDPWNLAWTFLQFGELARNQKEYARARAMASESLSLFRGIGTVLGIMQAQWICGDVARLTGDLDLAGALLVDMLRYSQGREIGPQNRTDRCLSSLGKLAIQRGDSRRGVILLGALQVRLEDWTRRSSVDRTENGAMLAIARSALGEDAFAQAWAEGEAMTRGQAVAYALGDSIPDLVPAHPAGHRAI